MMLLIFTSIGNDCVFHLFFSDLQKSRNTVFSNYGTEGRAFESLQAR